MYVSMNWIKDFVDLDGEDLEQLIHRFTLSTAEVEGIEYKGRDISNVVVGEIIMCQDHPDSDHLHVLKVDAGDKVYDVVCGAPNARTGIKTAFVKVGGQVGDMQIRAAKLRGIESFGMCCSAKELGISDDHSGIMELDPSYANGTDIKEIFPIDDVIFEVDNKSLTNRPDLWGHYGMAREFAALTGHELKALPVMDSDYTGDAEVPVEIRNKDLVFRYSSVRIENIQANVSPMEMQIRLYYCGMRAINLLADITNYIMLELGQPMHAFNGDKMKKIVVDTPKENMKFTTLDGQERDITTDTLMIWDGDVPTGIAGIMGGLDSEIVDDTHSVMLESANFDGVSIRKSASRMALRTDASARYEKTLDPEMTYLAVQRFIKLLHDSDPGMKCTTRITDVYVKKYPELTVSFDKKFIDRYTGIDISSEQIKTTLELLGFETAQDGDNFVSKVPSWRGTKDVSMKADIVEEITRIYGYDNFEIKTTLSPIIPAKTTRRRAEENAVRDLLVKTYACHEIHTRVWCDPDAMKDLSLSPEDNVKLVQASEEKGTGILRTSMMECLLPAVRQNRDFSTEYGIFEIGRVFTGTKEDGRADEHRHLAVCLYSKDRTEKELYFEAVEIINTIVDELKHLKASYQKTKTSHAWEHPKNTAQILVDGKAIGILNTLFPSVRTRIAKNAYVVCIEIDMDALLEVEPAEMSFVQPSSFPAVEYDLSLIIPDGVRFETIEKSWTDLKIKELRKTSIIDMYEAAGIRSIAIRFSFVADDRTLTGEEVQAHIDTILKNLEEIGVRLKLQ
ncbi:MAG: phenylalanine--tRNA ligase subunit beta [Lachnospiraceae bacterium]|nr:phenylalanine--tRNA ligase subunit beta [Lachnospiraceae bacterium]